MHGSSDQRRLARWLALLLTASAQIGAAQTLRSAWDGAGEVRSVAFVVEGGREAVTLRPAAKALDKVSLRDAGPVAAKGVADPVSRLVVFVGAAALPDGLALREESPGSGRLWDAESGEALMIGGRVKQVGGKYLPFTLLRVEYSGAVSRQGTPLLDADGRVAAVAHELEAGRAGFAVPVEVVQRVLRDVRRDGRVGRAWLGLKLDPAVATPQVTEVVAGSPAAEAGLKAGDVVIEAGGREVKDYGDAVNAFFLMQPLVRTSLKVRRDGGEQALGLVPAVARR